MKKLSFTQAYAFILGIDVSKESLDACLIRTADGQVFEQKFNNPEGFKKMKAWMRQQGSQADADTLTCMEHTGLYTRRLVHYLLGRRCTCGWKAPCRSSAAWVLSGQGR